MPNNIRKGGVINYYSTLPPEVRSYFSDLPKLLSNFSSSTALIYVFAMIEKAMNMTLYCGIIKLHSTESNLTRNAIEKYHVTRDNYKKKFELLFGIEIDLTALTNLENSEKVRDKIMLGNPSNDQERFKAIKEALEFSVLFNDQVYNKAGFRPFGSLQGFKGAKKPLKVDTTRLILKGLGFNIQ